MNRLHAGAVLERAPGPKYRDALGYAELKHVGPLPRAATLRRWREEVGDTLEIGLVVPTAATRSAAGPFRVDSGAETALLWTLEAADALRARFVILQTGADFTTGQRDRDLLERWLARFSPPQRERLVWHPAGLWEPEAAAPFARRIGALLAFDPLDAEAPPGDRAYGRLRAIGNRNRFGETLLREVVDVLAETPEAWVTIDSPRSFAEAVRLQALGEAEPEETA